MEPFQRRVMAAFFDRMAAMVAQDFPAEHRALGPLGVRALVERMIAWGAEHRVVTEGGVAVLLTLALQYGEGFERSPDRAWALRELAEVARPESARIESLLRRMAQRAQGRVVVIAPEE